MLEFMNMKFHDNLKAYSRAPKPIYRRTVVCHKMPQHCYLLSQCSKFCSHNSLHCFSADVYCCACDVRYVTLMADMKEQHVCTEFCYVCWKLQPETKTWVHCHDPEKTEQPLKWKCLFFAHKKKTKQITWIINRMIVFILPTRCRNSLF